ncbi:cytochrome o ubiquinol oxidase subunit IV [Sphingomonas swuensis]|uniref:Cytochrome bo(3) ubiquinol oxidase subunit 4 n=1 Tax=Sphingomonas swuensis TaxID=977800 RepID=A0ABP7T5N6_9SPHN
MSASTDHADGELHAHSGGELHAHGEEHGHGSKKSYLVGFALSAVLTAIPFWLVMAAPLANPGLTAVLVILLAIAQILVHTICFLHVNTSGEGGWTLLAYVFTGVLLLITICGSLWIMYHLNTNMMPGMMSAQVGAAP